MSKKIGAPPKDPKDKFIKISVSIRPDQAKALIKKGHIKVVKDRLQGLSKAIQFALDEIL